MLPGRVRGPLGTRTAASAAALTPSSAVCQRAAVAQAPPSRGRGSLTAGFASPPQRRRTRFPGARLGPCRRPALLKLPTTLAAVTAPGRQALRPQWHTLGSRARQRRGLRGCALGPQLRHVADHVAAPAGIAHGERGRRWGQDQKAGGYAGRAAPPRPVPSPL
jgi:hypothetical protein